MAVLYFAYPVPLEFVALHGGIQLLLYGLYGFLPVRLSAVTRPVYALLAVIFVSVAVVHADNVDTYGPILIETVNAVFQTHNAEAVSYLTTFTSPRAIPILIICVLAMIAGLWQQPALKQPPVLLMFTSVIIGLLLVYTGRSLPVMIYQTGVSYVATLEAYAASRSEVMADYQGVTAPGDRDIIVILGESTSRHHMSLYGYPRQTTPNLDRLTAEGQLLVFRDAIATHSHTNESLSQAFTFNNRDEFPEMNEIADLISVANQAGIETWWLSNQNPVGIWDNAVSAIAAEADRVVFHDKSSGFKRERDVYDEAMVSTLQSVLSDSSDASRLIIMHTMATHFPYCDMVPDDYQTRGLRFDQPVMDERYFGNHLPRIAEVVTEQSFLVYITQLNCYDRAVNYVDSLIEQVIDAASRSDQPAAVIYLADHGEAPILNTGHDSRKHSHRHVEIPLAVWTSEDFPLAIAANQTRRVTLEDFAFSIADLAAINGITDIGSRSFFSADYEEPLRRTLNGRIGYDRFDENADATERARGNLLAITDDRVWAHRINTGASYQEAAEFFSGVESDVVFLGDRFGVFHPPTPDVGLTLNDLLKQERMPVTYWLDWKNASLENSAAALERLTQLDREFGISDRALIEISAIDGSAQVFVEADWEVSYYLPTEQIAACQQNCSEAEAAAMATQLKGIIEKERFSAVSFDVALLPFIETYLLSYLQERELKAYTWATGVTISSVEAPEQLASILERQWLRGVLVSFPSYFKR